MAMAMAAMPPPSELPEVPPSAGAHAASDGNPKVAVIRAQVEHTKRELETAGPAPILSDS